MEGYSHEKCPNCGRVRLECVNGELICEKCKWNVTKGEYSNNEEEYTGFSI